jgi:hypothetical protein
MVLLVYGFPTPYPDELLYSVFARYQVRSGNLSPKVTLGELFGQRTITSVWDLPSNLTTLLSRLEISLDLNQLVLKHTMFPYYAPFLLPRQEMKVKQSMYGKEGSLIHTRIGVTASVVKYKTNFWVCSSCVEEDINAYGETYWHRSHQAPGVLFCPIHKETLKETNIPLRGRNHQEFVAATPLVNQRVIDIEGLRTNEIEVLLGLSKFTGTILKECHPNQTSNDTIRDRYVELLKKNGYASVSGFVNRELVYKKFQEMYSSEVMRILQSTVNFEESNWLWRIFRKHRNSFHPIRHFLVMQLLGIELEDLFDEEKYHPFGKGPWICLNRTCKGYHQEIVNDQVITRCSNTKKPIGTFKCISCGFVFSRRGPDLDESDKFRIGMIKDYGHVWKQQLAQLIQQGNNLTQVSHELQVDPATVKKHAAGIGIKTKWKLPKVKKSKIVETSKDTLLLKRKEKWLNLQKLNPQKTITELRNLEPAIYKYIYRKDRSWLNLNSPARNQRFTHNNKSVDWEKRDKELLKLVIETVGNWKEGPDKSIRITVSSIGKKIKKLALLTKKAEYLPMTMNYINEISEDIVDFQKRRIDNTIQILIEDGERILEWEIYRKAALRPTVSNEVKQYIYQRVNEYETFK